MFWKKKNNNDFTNIIGLTNTQDIVFSKSGDFWLTISQALLCLLLCVGSICGYASCFSAQFNLAAILIILSVASFVIAFTRNLKSGFLKNIIYILFLFAFIFSILKYFRYVNSGYHALVNMTYASLENYLEIPALVYYEELIENSYTTITLFLIFLGVFELLLFHMWIGERIHLLSIFLISFGLYIIPLFINLYPDELYVLFLLTSYISLIMICLSQHINNHPVRKKSYRVFTRKNPWSTTTSGFSYGVNGLNYFMTTLLSLLLAVSVIFIVGIITPRAAFQNNLRTSQLKQDVTDDVKYLVTFGLSGYFNRYDAAGGLNDGRLGGIYSVRPDYETDLTVTYVPLSYDPLYLRGYVGIGYTDRQWHSVGELYDDEYISEEYFNKIFSDTLLTNEYNYLKEINLARTPSLISIKNVGAKINFSYSPYYCNPEEITLITGAITEPFRINQTRDYSYYYYMTSANNNAFLDNSYSFSEYLQVPASTHEAIVDFLIENDLCTEYITSDSVFPNYTPAQIEEIVNRISECLTNDFTYSLNPGITPGKKDFVGYFLENKKGFCAHFATSATLIFRTLGIPARYVEGYVVTSEDLAEGTILTDVDASLYFDTSLVQTDLHVVQADIGDDKAHAWVEYYTPEFGWRTFEATTASMEQSTNTDFWRSLFDIFSEVEATEESVTDTGIGNVSGNIASFLYKLILIILAIAFALCILYFSYRFTKQYRSYHRNNMNINVRNFYKIICLSISRKYPEFNYLISYPLQLDFICQHYKLHSSINNNNCDKLAKILEQSAFSNEEITSTEFQFAMKLLKLLRRNITLKF